MLDDHAGRALELAHALDRGVRVRDVVVREFLALQLPCRRDRSARGQGIRVERRRLMRVLAVAQVLLLAESGREGIRERACRPAGGRSQPDTSASYWAVWPKAFAASRRRDRLGDAARAQLRERARVVRGIDEHGDARVVLGGGPQHRGTPDVDVLDRVLVAAVRARNGLGERIEVDDEDVDRLDALFAHDGVVGAGAAEQGAVDFRVQGLHAPVHDLREAGQRRHLGHREARRRRSCAPCRRSRPAKSRGRRVRAPGRRCRSCRKRRATPAGRSAASSRQEASPYSRSFLRRVPRLMPRMVAARLWLPSA